MSGKILVRNKLSNFIDTLLYSISEYGSKVDKTYSKSDNCDILVAREKSNMINRYTSKSIVYQYNNKNNILQAVKSLNGIVIRPNTSFSFLNSVLSSNKNRIYREGIDIENDEEIIGHGRGISQLSTQILLTMLHSKLDLVEHRSSILSKREYSVNYPSGFVTIVDNIWDLKFENNTENTYTIRARVDGDELITELYTNRKEIEDVELCITRKYNEHKRVNKLVFNRNVHCDNKLIYSEEVLSLGD